MALPQTARAVVKQDTGVAVIDEVPLPKLRDGHVLVKTKAVAINPTDWKYIDTDDSKTNGVRSGCDYSGEVVAVGAGVTNFKVGDRIAGFVPGANVLEKDDGAFGEYVIAQADVQFHNPLSDEEGASLGVSIFTVGQGLFQNLGLQLPSDPVATPEPILIYGGSTASGLLGIQFAKLAGYKVITTASPHNFDYLKSLGADAVFDYKSPTVVDDIIAAAGGELTHAWDCISLEPSAKICAAAISDKGGKLGLLLPVDPDVINRINPKIESSSTLAYSITGQPLNRYGKEFPGSQEDNEFAKEWRDLSEQLFREGKAKPAKIDVNRGGSGLEGVLVGLDELRNDKVSGVKLIYTI
ncbi:GroES-like protein [Trichoderma sp. SZMC 28015]